MLDIALTLESLETLGVPVVGVGTEELPSLYSRSGGHASPLRLDTAAEVAALLRATWDLMGLGGGVVVAATPYLLGRIVEITGGASLRADIALVRNDARLGAAIARE